MKKLRVEKLVAGLVFLVGMSVIAPTEAAYYQNNNNSSNSWRSSNNRASHKNMNHTRSRNTLLNSNNRGRQIANAEQPADKDLKKNIRDELKGGWLTEGYERVTVRVDNGHVTLDGQVETWDDKKNLEENVRNMDGVISLESNLSVQEPSEYNDQSSDSFSQDTAARSTDNQLNKKIRDKVSRGWFWDSYQEVSIHSDNGVITLKGTVDSLDEEQDLVNRIQKIKGVKQVRSELVVENAQY